MPHHLGRTRHEHDARSGGGWTPARGRTRFISIWGIWIGVLFLVAIAFNTISVFWIGLCGG